MSNQVSVELLALISDLSSSNDTYRKSLGSEIKRLTSNIVKINVRMARYFRAIEEHIERRPYTISSIEYGEIIERVDAEIKKERENKDE